MKNVSDQDTLGTSLQQMQVQDLLERFSGMGLSVTGVHCLGLMDPLGADGADIFDEVIQNLDFPDICRIFNLNEGEISEGEISEDEFTRDSSGLLALRRGWIVEGRMSRRDRRAKMNFMVYAESFDMALAELEKAARQTLKA